MLTHWIYRFGMGSITIRKYAMKKCWWILIFTVGRQTTKPLNLPNFTAVQYFKMKTIMKTDVSPITHVPVPVFSLPLSPLFVCFSVLTRVFFNTPSYSWVYHHSFLSLFTFTFPSFCDIQLHTVPLVISIIVRIAFWPLFSSLRECSSAIETFGELVFFVTPIYLLEMCQILQIYGITYMCNKFTFLCFAWIRVVIKVSLIFLSGSGHSPIT